MGRWEPDAQGRLIQAALDLYSEREFQQTTLAETAKRAVFGDSLTQALEEAPPPSLQ